MSSWEEVLKEHRQQEIYRKCCFQRLQKLKAERKEAKELEKRIFDMLGSFQIPPNSGFNGE
jgi:hypothetical protein